MCISYSLAMYSWHHSLLIKGKGVIYDENTRKFCDYVIYFQRKNNLVNFLREESALQKNLSSLLRYKMWAAKLRTFWMKIVEQTCKFMTTKRLMVYHTIKNQMIWSNKSVILCILNSNTKCLDVIISHLLTPCTKFAAYNSTTLVILSLLETLFLILKVLLKINELIQVYFSQMLSIFQ